jgi:hypothetical protein
MQFELRSDVIIWMIDSQKNKRNANKMMLTYLIGRQYIEQKNSDGTNRYTIKLHQNDGANETAQKVAKRSGVGQATVERAAVFATSLDTIVKNTGIKRQEILLGSIKAKQEDIKNSITVKK